jgi:choice-of-anchor B domain-containing protein
MKKVHLALGLSLCLLPIATLLADEDMGTYRPYPSPRHSGQGRVPFTSSNVHLLGWVPLSELSALSTSGNDCWGYTSPLGREYAIIGTSDGTGFVEVTDPGMPTLVAFHDGPDSLWRDMKIYGDNAYVVSEGGSGIQIFDMSNIDAGAVSLVNTITTGGCTTASHNVAIDTISGYLYRCGGSSSPCAGGTPQGLVIYDLGTNPNNPPFVTTWSTRYVHDCVVVVSTRPGALNGRQLAFCAADDGSGGGTANLQILDVTNKASITTVANAAYTSNAFSHQVWLTPDQRHAYLNDELDEQSFGFTTRTRIFDVSNPAAPVFLGFFTSGSTSIDHNLYVTSDKIYEANYRSGLRVFDSSVPTAPTVYGFFDTYEPDDAADFNGLWSNYPFFPSGTVIGSDLEKGLFVWRTGAAKLSFAFPSGVPEFIGPGGETVQFEVFENVPGDLLPGTVQFHYSTGGAFTSVNAAHLGGDLYEAVMPPFSCGTALDFYVSAQANDDVTWTDPPAAPTQVHKATAAYGEVLALEDDFETNTGWLVNLAADLVGFSTATTGTWIRANPIGTAAQPEDDHTANPGALCFVTANGAVGGGVGDADIDGGATSLRSPALDASGLSNAHIQYWRWYSNSAGASPGEDTMTVDISNDGGSSWVLLETVGPTGPDVLGGWIEHTARIADFVSPTNNMRLRFRASDLINGSIVEAAVDDLRIFDLDCTPPNVMLSAVSPRKGPFEGGNVVTLTGTGFQAGVTTVQFGSSPPVPANVIDSTTLKVVVPRARSPIVGKVRPMTVDVSVANPGSHTLPKSYTYTLD